MQIVIPPRSTAVLHCEIGPPTQRDEHLEAIAAQGRLAWQKASGYGRRALVETTMATAVRHRSAFGQVARRTVWRVAAYQRCLFSAGCTMGRVDAVTNTDQSSSWIPADLLLLAPCVDHLRSHWIGYAIIAD